MFALGVLRVPTFQHRGQQGFLRGEVVEQAGVGDPDPPGDLAQRRAVVAGFGVHRDGRRDDVLPADPALQITPGHKTIMSQVDSRTYHPVTWRGPGLAGEDPGHGVVHGQQGGGRAGPELIEARQYVLDSDWGEAQPGAEDENAYLESHSWDEYAAGTSA